MKFKTILGLVGGSIAAVIAYICSVIAGGAWKELKESRKTKEEVKEDIKETTETKEEDVKEEE